MADKLWKGRFTEKTAKVVERFTASIDVDMILARRMEQAASTGYINATDLADYLVRQGLAFREAHHCVGQAVRRGLDQGKELLELSLAELQSGSPLVKEDVFDQLAARETVNRRTGPGGTARSAVLAAIQAAEQRLV